MYILVVCIRVFDFFSVFGIWDWTQVSRAIGEHFECPGSTEKDIETRLTKAWTAINRLSTIWKSDLTDKMKRSFCHIDTAIVHYMDADKTAGEETRWQLHKNAACNPEQVLAATPHKTPTVRTPAPYHEIYSS